MNENHINNPARYQALHPTDSCAAASACDSEAPGGPSTPASAVAQVVARFAPDELPVQHRAYEGVEYLTFDIPNGWDDVKKVCKKVLVFEGKRFTFSCWNSDRMECVFRWFPGVSESVAKIVSRKKGDAK